METNLSPLFQLGYGVGFVVCGFGATLFKFLDADFTGFIIIAMIIGLSCIIGFCIVRQYVSIRKESHLSKTKKGIKGKDERKILG